MTITAESLSAKYLYAVVDSVENRMFSGAGIDGQRVYLIADQQIGAVVSDCAKPRIRPERRHLAAHQGVLKELMATTTPLPVTFGVIVDTARDMQRLLTLNRRSLVTQLRQVRNKVEMGLRVSLDIPNIFEYYVRTHVELRTARDHLLGAPRAPSQEGKIEVGRIFDRLLQADREQHRAAVEAVLAPWCADIRSNPPRNEHEVMNLACLVRRSAVASEFEAAVFEAARNFDHHYTFDMNGPWAPHHFVKMELEV